jgi:hypothetical protein
MRSIVPRKAFASAQPVKPTAIGPSSSASIAYVAPAAPTIRIR